MSIKYWVLEMSKIKTIRRNKLFSSNELTSRKFPGIDHSRHSTRMLALAAFMCFEDGVGVRDGACNLLLQLVSMLAS
jgi:hypothetical protein